LKKKYVEAPEIEKEVKRLLRVDNDAVNVKWEVICEDDDQSKPNKVSSSGTVKTKRENINGNTSQSLDVGKKCSTYLFIFLWKKRNSFCALQLASLLTCLQS